MLSWGGLAYIFPRLHGHSHKHGICGIGNVQSNYATIRPHGVQMKKAAAIVLSVAISGCATTNMGENYRPIVDTKGRDAAQYESDLRECQAYASQAAGAAQQAAAGAAAGAIFGALLAAAAGGGYSRNSSAMVGGLLGATGGAAQGETDQRNIIRTCLSNRGYSVLQ